MKNLYIFNDLESLREKFPRASEIIESENNIQYPNAKLIIAGIERIKDDDFELNAFFDIDNPGMVLWINVPGNENEGYYIDEYYEIHKSEAETYHSFFSQVNFN